MKNKGDLFMYCKNCGQELNDYQAICLKCGVEVGKGNTHCAHCGNEVHPNAMYCLSCGVALQNKNAPVNHTSTTQSNNDPNYLAGQNKTTMALVCFFLGGLGIHNFMMGESKRGVGKIIMSCLCGIGGILALIDFIKILSGTYVVDTEKMF